MSDRLDAIRARLEAATPGPWERNDQHTKQHGIAGPLGLHATAWEDRDAEFIAHARADVAWLLDKVERLESERDAWKLEAQGCACSARRVADCKCLDESGATAT